MSAPDTPGPSDPAAPSDAAPPYAGLTPEVALAALESVGLWPSGQVLALNSYENRVFLIGLDEPHGGQASVVAKFYRPGRWSDGQILEEHGFVAELAAAEIPAVPSLELAGATLHHAAGFRFAVFPRRGGRAPNLDDRDTLRWLGRFLARIHAVGAREPFRERLALDAQTFGEEPLAWLLEHGWLPPDLAEVYRGVARQALDEVSACYARAGRVASLRLHGDVHEGNVLWTEAGPHFVDFDDSRSGPAVQDLWMLLGGREEAPQRLNRLLEGYEQFRPFDRRELHLIEALRTLRLIQHSAWIARRWNDPAFPAAFPWFDSPRYWEARVLELREQIAAMAEPPLAV